MNNLSAQVASRPLVLHTRPALEMNDDEFYDFCQDNPEWRLERSAEGEVFVMPPAGWETGNQNALVTTAFTNWALQDGTGVPSDSSAGFILPNGAIRSPDAAWVTRTRLAALTSEQKKKFLPLCPDFVIELRSPSDRLEVLQDKMREYLENGARLGWLIDPPDQRVYVYRPGVAVQRLDNPTVVSGDPELPGFVFDLEKIWQASF